MYYGICPRFSDKDNMEEEKSIAYIIERCESLDGGNMLSMKLQLLDLLLLIQKAVKELQARIELLQDRPLMDLLSKPQYEECRQKVEELSQRFKVSLTAGISTIDYNKYVVDYLFPGSKIDSNRENADKIRLVINTLESNVFDSVILWEEGVKNGLHELAESLERMSVLSEKQWNTEEYVRLVDDLTKKHLSRLSSVTIRAYELFNRWKEGSYGDPEEDQALVASHLKRLLDSDFIIIEEEHLTRSYRRHLETLYSYIPEEECAEDYRRKFYFLNKWMEHKEGRFSFCKDAVLGKYIFLHRETLRNEDIEAFFLFKKICMLVYEDKDKTQELETEAESSAGVTQNQEENNAEVGNSEIPQDCNAAVEKVLNPQFTIGNGVVMNSRKQITHTAMKINVTRNVEVAMLMKIGMKLGAVRPGVKCPDFVRALIGLGVIQYTYPQAISKMADGMTKKINGYKSKGKTLPPLPDSHLQWKDSDKNIGKVIYNNMISQNE